MLKLCKLYKNKRGAKFLLEQSDCEDNVSLFAFRKSGKYRFIKYIKENDLDKLILDLQLAEADLADSALAMLNRSNIEMVDSSVLEAERISFIKDQGIYL